MPELPEVETMVRDLRERIVPSQIVSIETYWDRIVGHPAPADLASGVRGKRIVSIDRKGKFAIFGLDDRSEFAIHRGMTGSLLLRPSGSTDDRFVRARLLLGDGRELRLDDARKFGRVFWRAVDDHGWTAPWTVLGMEPLSEMFTAQALAGRLANRRATVKVILLDQKMVAGIGNIYADESLYEARIHPARPGNSLSTEETARLRDAVSAVLQAAIEKRGTTFSTYKDVEGLPGGNQKRLMVFQRHGQSCHRCGRLIVRIVLGGRGTHYCPGCQQ